MLTSSTHTHRRVLASTVLGLLLVGTATVPASADPRDDQWHLDSMKAEQMWKTSTGKGTTVAVIDTGVDWTNGDLKGRVLPGKDFNEYGSGDEHTDKDGHGTGMAGIIAGTGKGNGGHGAYGLAPGAKILPVRIDVTTVAASIDKEYADAIRYAVDADAKIINISQGAGVNNQELNDAVAYAIEHGALIFAATGNSGNKDNTVQYPAATPGVVGVAAVGKDGRRASFSNYGSHVDMAAPGEAMVHACVSETGLCKSKGTSDATALASASAALIWSAHPDWTNNQVLRVMLNTIGGPSNGAKRSDTIGYGIVRPRIALTNPGDPGPANKYPLPDYPVKASKAPSASASTDPSTDADSPQAGSGAPSSDSDSSKFVLWGGLAAVVVLAAAVTIGAVIRRRNF